MAKIKSLRWIKTKENTEKLSEKKAKKAVLDNEGTTDYNMRVKIPDKEKEDLSDVDLDALAEQEINDRMKIKVEAQLRYDRMQKNQNKKFKPKK